MLDYSLHDISEFWCYVDWLKGKEASFSFAASGETFLGLALYHADGVVTLVRNQGDRVETLQQAMLSPGQSRTHVAIRFLPAPDMDRYAGIEIALDAEPWMAMDTSGLSDLHRDTKILCDGAVEAVSCGVWPLDHSLVSRTANLFLGPRLSLVGFIKADTPEARNVTLVVSPFGHEIPLVASEMYPEGMGGGGDWCIEAPLPGWIWEDGADQVGLTLWLGATQLGQLSVTRAEVLTMIEQAAAELDPATDAGNALTVVEHVVYGRFLPVLSLTAAEFVQRTATLYGLDAFLSQARTAEPALRARPETRGWAPDIGKLAVTRAVELGARLATDGQAGVSAALDDIVRSFSLKRNQRQDFYLQLTESFILSGKFHALLESARRNTDVLAGIGSDNWSRSIIMPYMAHMGMYAELGDALWEINPADGWLVTPGIAHAIAWLLQTDPVDDATEDQIRRAIYGYMNLVRGLKSSYWGRAQCAALLATSSRMIRGAGRFPAYLQRDIQRFVLECHGLSASFWHELAQDCDGLPAAVRMARGHFQTIAAYADAHPAQRGALKDALLNALRFFAQVNPADAQRFLRELLPGEDQLACLSGALPGLGLPEDQVLPEMVRVIAHPSFAGDASEHAAELRRALGACATDVAQPTDVEAVSAAVATLRALEQALKRKDATAIQTAILQAEAAVGGLIRAGSSEKATELSVILTGLILKAKKPGDAAIRTCARSNALLEGRQRSHPTPGLIAALDGVRDTPLATHPLMGTLLQDRARDLAPIFDAGMKGSRVFDTVVTIISCRKYLQARRPAMLKAWVGKLQALGIPYVFVIGGERTALNGDVLELACPDDYEHLPEKVLATIRWVHEHTSFGFMMKIDDDCFLNVDAFFHQNCYRDHDYYGRGIYRPVGGMDRMWHMQKSSTHRARRELDKSPEPSFYADGGSAYSLSRRAVRAILDQVGTPQGALLKNSSYMEDKLIGDLLARAGIRVSSNGYNIAVFRKLQHTQTSVAMFSNSFLPSRVWPVAVAHLDRPELFPKAAAQAKTHSLRPAKIWPSFTAPQTGANTNALELVSDHKGVPDLLAAELAVICCVRNERHIMPAFLAHYRALGVKSFIISDNCSTDGTLSYLLEQPDVVCFACDTEYRHSTYAVAWQQALLSGFRCGLWSVVVDADEFLVFPGYKTRSISDFVREQDSNGHDAICCFMLDMYPSGPLDEFDIRRDDPFKAAAFVDREPLRPVWFHGPYSNSYSWTSSVRHRLAPNADVNSFTSQKTCILKYKPWMQLSAGLHYTGDARISEIPGILCHFKYHSGFHAKVLEEIRRNQHFDNSAEYRAYAEALGAGTNCFYTQEGSVMWEDADIIRQVLAEEIRLSSPIKRAETNA